MKQEIKKKWVTALRSGKYRQGRGKLKVALEEAEGGFNFGHCCLGVLCDLRLKKTTDPIKKRSLEFQIENGSFLPKNVIEWAGLNGTNPVINGVTLSSINDSGETFEYIADVIEKEL